MKNLTQNSVTSNVVKASITTYSEGFCCDLYSKKTNNVKQWLIATVLFTGLFLVGFAVLAQPTISSVTMQNEKNAITTSTMCPWTIADPDFNDPVTTGGDVVGISSVTKSTETINGVSCRKMQTVIKKKKAGIAQVFISVGNANIGFLYVEGIDFKLSNDIVSMSIPGHMNDAAFLSSGFHPGEVFNIALKVVNTETGAFHPGTNGYAFVNIIGSGFTFNGGVMAQTVMFNNGTASVTLNANNPNSGYCYFKISDDSLPGSIVGSDVLHTAMISLTPPALSMTCSANNVSCGATNNGSATVSVTGGTTPYLYSCSNGINNSNNPTFTSLAPGTYTATVTDFYGNAATRSFSISQNVLNIQGQVSMPFCTNNSGAIDLTVTGSSSPLNYSWNDGITTEDRSNLLPGIYSVTVNGGPGCFSTASFNLSQPNAAPQITCIPDMSVNMLSGKNYAIVDFAINAVDECPATLNVKSNPPSGSAFYKGVTSVTCTATDALGLTSSCSFNITVNDNEAPVAKISDKTVSLTSNGTVTLTPSMLKDSSTDNCGIMSRVISPNILNSSNIGTTQVTMTVKDGNNNYWIIKSDSIKYYNNNNVLISTHTTLGKVSVLVTGDGGFIVTDDGRVRKYDKNGNLQSTIFTTGDVRVILISGGGFIVIDGGRVRLYDKDGNLKATIFTTGTTQVIPTPCDGGFIVVDDGRVRKYDKDGNLQSTIFTTGAVKIILTEPCGFIVIDDGRVRKYDGNGILQSTIFTTGNVQVIPMSGGGFIVTDDGRVRLYDSNGNLKSTIFTNGNVQIIKTPCDGGFIVVDDGRVRKYDKDGNLQSTIFTTGAVKIILTEPCGFIVIDDGRVRKYDDNGNLQSTIFTTGNVTVITTGDGGFIVIDDGRVRLYDNNGNLKSTIFTNGNVQVIKTPCDGGFIVVDDGRVRKYDKDGNLQSTIFTTGVVTIIQTEPCGFIVQDDGRVRKYDSNGNLQSTIFTTGAVKVIPMSGGGFIVTDDGRVRKYDKDGNLQSTIFTTGVKTAIPDASGGFKVTDDGRIRVYDKNGNLLSTIYTVSTLPSYIFTNGSLSGSATVIVIVPNPITLGGTIANVDCSGKKTGKITLSVNGITGPYTYSWNNGQSSKNLTKLGAGTYTVVVNDAYGSSNTITFVVVEPPALIINTTKTMIKCAGLNTGTATAAASGGISPYTYSWNTVPVQTGSAAGGLSAGIYSVTVTDANGCTKTKSVTITQNQPVSVVIQQSFDHATAVPSGGIGPYSYKWNTSPQQTTSTATGLICGHTYTVTVKDSKGCSAVVTFTMACRIGESVENSGQNVNVFPNPTPGVLTVDILTEDSKAYNVEVLDELGRVAFAENDIHPGNNKMSLDLSALSDGVYSLKITSGYEIKFARVIVQK